MEKLNNKVSFRQSSLTTWRQKEPSNPYMSSKVQTSMFDFSKGMNLWPDQRGNSLIENRSGRGKTVGINKGANLTFSMRKASGGDGRIGEPLGVVSYSGDKKPRKLSTGKK